MKKTVISAAAGGALLALAGAATVQADQLEGRSWSDLTWDELFGADKVYMTFNSAADVRKAVQHDIDQTNSVLQHPDQLQGPIHNDVPNGYTGPTCYSVSLINMPADDLAMYIYKGSHDLPLLSIPLYSVFKVPATERNGALVPTEVVKELNQPFELGKGVEELKKIMTHADGPQIPAFAVTYTGCEQSPAQAFRVAVDMNVAAFTAHRERVQKFLEAYGRHLQAPQPKTP